MQKVALRPLYNQVKTLEHNFGEISYFHIFNENNMNADNFSKQGPYLKEETWQIGIKKAGVLLPPLKRPPKLHLCSRLV